MPLTRTLRPLAICLALLVSFGLAACSSSSDDNDSSTQGSGGGAATSSKEYCDALQSAISLSDQAASGDIPDDFGDQVIDVMTRAVNSAPAAVRGDLLASFGGDPYALDDLKLYNEQECGYEFVPPPSTP
jgi:hypothetical protein